MNTKQYDFIKMRYHDRLFKFVKFDKGEFYYAPTDDVIFFPDEYLKFILKPNIKIHKELLFQDILTVSVSFPDVFMEEEFLVHPIDRIRYEWRTDFEEYLLKNRLQFEIEVVFCMLKIIDVSSLLKKLQNPREIKLYQALFIFQNTKIELIRSICGEHTESLIKSLKDIGLVLDSD